VPEPCRPRSPIDSPPAKRGRRSAEDASQPLPRGTSKRCRLPKLRARLRATSEARPPSGATPRLSPGTVTFPTQLQAMLPGSGIKRALPALSGPSSVAAPHASAVVPKGMNQTNKNKGLACPTRTKCAMARKRVFLKMSNPRAGRAMVSFKRRRCHRRPIGSGKLPEKRPRRSRGGRITSSVWSATEWVRHERQDFCSRLE